MEENMYTLLNEMDFQLDTYEECEVSAAEIKRWKKAFNRRKETGRNHARRYVAAAVAVLAIGLAMGPFKSQVYAQIEVITIHIQEWMNTNKDLSPYETVVGKSVSKDGITVTLNDVILDGQTMMLSYTVTTSEKIENVEEEMKYSGDVSVLVDGKLVDGGSAGSSEKQNDHNMVSMPAIVLDDIDLTKEHDYKLVFTVGNETIGSMKFTASGENLSKETTTIPINTNYELPNGDQIQFTRFTMNPVGPKVYCESATRGFDYDVILKGQDDLGNKIEFYLTHFDGGREGWFILSPRENNYIRDEASYLTLSLYAVEYPEQSGEISNDYQVIGEPFTIQLK